MRSLKIFAAVVLTLGLNLADARAQLVCPKLAEIKTKWDLFRSGTCLRGANVWQRREHTQPNYPPYSVTALQELGSWGANYVNLSVPGPFTEKPPYVVNSYALSSLDTLINNAEKANLFVVISFRTGPGRNESVFGGETDPVLDSIWRDSAAQQAWVDMWKFVADRYRNRKHVVAYDLMVEPEREDIHTLWSQMAYAMSAAIRSVDQNTPIIIGGAGWSHYSSLEMIVPTGDSKTAYAVHQYDPFEYSHNEGGRRPSLNYLRKIYNVLRDFRTTTGQPVLVNEFGAVWKVSGAQSFIRDQFGELERIGSSNALWIWESRENDYQGSFTIYRAPSGVKTEIKNYWGKNSIRPGQISGRW
jgi:aryl-phospho-beta-D-glucosidase BglC (GH1 family)